MGAIPRVTLMRSNRSSNRFVWLMALGIIGCSPDGSPPSPAPQPLVDLVAVRKKAETGDASAEALLGKCYAEGQGTQPDYTQAVKWYRAAVAQGNAEAEAGLGELYEAGQGVTKDMAEAARLYRASADKGCAVGQYNLAFLYEQGRFFKVDQAEATKWYRLAAEGGNAIAQYDLGQRYDLGVGVPVDKVEALFWLEVAAANGQVDAGTRQKPVRDKLSRAEREEAGRRAKAFKPRGSQ